MTKKSFVSELRLHTNNSVDRNDGAEKESCGQETCGQQAQWSVATVAVGYSSTPRGAPSPGPR